MKFIAVFVAALSLSSNVIAAPLVTSAPVSTLPAAPGLTGTVEGLPGVETATGLEGSVTELLTRSDISVITDAIAALNASLTSDLTTLPTAIASDVSTSVVATVESFITHIALALNNTILTIVPAVTGTVVPLTPDEVDALITALGDMNSIVSLIKTTLVSTTATLSFDALEALQPEISVILSLINPLVSPLIGLAESVAATVVDPGNQNTLLFKLTTAANELIAVAGGLLSPVSHAIASTL